MIQNTSQFICVAHGWYVASTFSIDEYFTVVNQKTQNTYGQLIRKYSIN